MELSKFQSPMKFVLIFQARLKFLSDRHLLLQTKILSAGRSCSSPHIFVKFPKKAKPVKNICFYFCTESDGNGTKLQPRELVKSKRKQNKGFLKKVACATNKLKLRGERGREGDFFLQVVAFCR